MIRNSAFLGCVLGLLAGSLPAAAASLTATPTSLAFTYQLAGAGQPPAALPVAQNIGLKTVGSLTASFTVTTPPADAWLTVTPLKGTAPTTIKVYVNPTSLTAGLYSSSIAIAPPGTTGVTVAVTLTVKAPQPILTVSPASITQTLQSGAAPLTATLNVASSGSPLAFTATTAGGAWISATPPTGLALASPPTAVKVSLDAGDLVPGAYKGTVNIGGGSGAKPIAVAVALTVTAAPPTITALWPDKISQGSLATTITILGTGYYAKSVAKAGTTALKTTVLSTSALQAVLPADLLATAAGLAITVSNIGVGDSPAATFQVQAPKPAFTSAGVVNGASYAAGAVAAGEIITIFGSGLGPSVLQAGVPDTSGKLPTTLAGTTLTFDGTTPAPLLYVQDGQLSAVVPYGVDGKSNTNLVVDFQGQKSDVVTMGVAAAAPGIFAGAVFNVDPATGAWSLNTEKNPAIKGNWIVVYATGGGQLNPAGTDGAIIGATPPVPILPAAANVGGLDVVGTSVSASGAPGFISGLLQVNVQLPSTVTGGTSVPLILQFGTGSAALVSPTAKITVK